MRAGLLPPRVMPSRRRPRGVRPSLPRGVMPSLALPPLLLLLSGAFAGCACTQLLDVRNVAEIPDDAEVRDWTAQDAARWPEVDRLLAGTAPGDHTHVDWSEAQAQALWAYLGVPGDEPRKQAFLRLGEHVFRVRVLTC